MAAAATSVPEWMTRALRLLLANDAPAALAHIKPHLEDFSKAIGASDTLSPLYEDVARLPQGLADTLLSHMTASQSLQAISALSAALGAPSWADCILKALQAGNIHGTAACLPSSAWETAALTSAVDANLHADQTSPIPSAVAAA